MGLGNPNPHEKGGPWPIAVASHIAQITKQVPKAHQKPGIASEQDHPTCISWMHTIFLALYEEYRAQFLLSWKL